MTPHPPRFALALLNWLVPENNPLIGDLVEEFERRRSRVWFWRQAIVAIAASRLAPRRETTPLGLADGPLPIAREELHVPVNLSASPLASAGGLGIVALGVIVALYRPGAWWFVLAAIAGGLVIGVVRVLLTRGRFRRDPEAFLLEHGVRHRPRV